MRAPVAWVAGIGLGAVAGALASPGLPAGAVGAIAAVIIVVTRGWPLRASIGGLLLGVGAVVAVAQGIAFAGCLPDDPDMATCFARTQASFGLARVAAAGILLGLAASLLAVNLRGGPPSIARVRGALVALAIAAVAVSAEALFQPAPAGRFDALGIAFLSGSGAPTIAAAVIGGWLLGPTASLRKTRFEWAWLAIGMAILAVVIGALAVGLGMGLERAISGGYDGAAGAWLWVPYGLVLAVFGVLFVGPFVFPIALCASSLWTGVMARQATG